MDFQEVNYIITYFSRLMTDSEKKAKNHYFFSSKLGKPEDYETPYHYKKRKEFFEKRNGISSNPQVIKLLEKGYDEFMLRTAIRIKKDTPNEYLINRCPNCNFIARTPYAKQCRNCKNDWHYKVAGTFQFEETFRITGKPYLWIVGEITKGLIQKGDRIDLTHFQLNIIAKIKQIEFCLKSVNGIRKDYPSLGIEVSLKQEELIKNYLTKSAKSIIILKGE